MTPWAWYWKFPDDEAYGEECASREAVIAAAEREVAPGDAFVIVEARMSEAAKHEYSDVIPFLRTRNRETITAGRATTSGPITFGGDEVAASDGVNQTKATAAPSGLGGGNV